MSQRAGARTEPVVSIANDAPEGPRRYIAHKPKVRTGTLDPRTAALSEHLAEWMSARSATPSTAATPPDSLHRTSMTLRWSLSMATAALLCGGIAYAWNEWGKPTNEPPSTAAAPAVAAPSAATSPPSVQVPAPAPPPSAQQSQTDDQATERRATERRSTGGPTTGEQPEPASSQHPAPVEASPPAAAIEAKAKPPNTLNAAETGEVQALLRYLSFDPGPVDGVLGPRTTAAVRRYQESRGLERNGIADKALLTRLRSEGQLPMPKQSAFP